MATTGFGELILMLAMMGGAGGGVDVATVIPAKEYFKARDIDPTVEKLIDLAGQQPDSPKTQMAQLLALRQLTADVESLKKSAKLADHRRLIKDIAAGKKANDATGFAADYAKRLLVALDGGKIEATKRGTWREGAAWIPSHVNFLSGVDSSGMKATDMKVPELTPVFGLMPKEAKDMFFDSLDKLGNFRLDRFVLGMAEPEKGKMELYARITGKGDPERLLAFMKEMGAKPNVQERTGPNGVKIRVLTFDHDNPALAMVGDSDFLIAGFPPDGPRNKDGSQHIKALEKMLALALKPGPDATQGVLKDQLAKVPAAANGILVGELPSAMQKGAPFPMPQKILAHSQRTAGGIDFVMNATMAGEAESKQLVQTIAQGRDAGIQQLGKLQGQPLPIPGVNINSIINLLESIQLQTDGAGMQLRMLVPSDAVLSLPGFFFLAARG
jgi:hypothetical protein